MNEEFARNIKQHNIEWAFFKFTIETNLFTRINQELKIIKQETSEENFGPKRDEISESVDEDCLGFFQGELRVTSGMAEAEV